MNSGGLTGDPASGPQRAMTLTDTGLCPTEVHASPFSSAL